MFFYIIKVNFQGEGMLIYLMQNCDIYIQYAFL